VQAFTQACVASQSVVLDATAKAQFRLRAAQCHINPRQSKVLERLLEAGHVRSGGGFLVSPPSRPKGKRASLGGSEPHAVGSVEALSSMTNEKYAKITGISKATRYAVNVPGWAQPVVRP
jgi:hypothetical protein